MTGAYGLKSSLFWPGLGQPPLRQRSGVVAALRPHIPDPGLLFGQRTRQGVLQRVNEALKGWKSLEVLGMPKGDTGLGSCC
jgi:hypothetical protein